MSLIIPGAPQFSLYENNAPGSPSSNLGVAVGNPAGAANTKDTSWTQLIASTAFDAQLVVVTIGSSSAAATDTSTLIDIGIGASTAESVLIPDILAGGVNSANNVAGTRHHIFPLYLPAGSRVSARAQSVRTTGYTSVSVELWGGPRNPDRWWCGTTVTAYGINTADSGGTAVTAGNSGAETATPVAIGTTSADHEALIFAAACTGTITASLDYRYDVGIDVASTSWLVRDSFFFRTATSESLGPSGTIWWPIFAHIPSGSVLVSGGECGGTADALIDVALYGVS